MKKFYEKPNVEFLSFRLLELVASNGVGGTSAGSDEGEDFYDPGYQFGDDGPGL